MAVKKSQILQDTSSNHTSNWYVEPKKKKKTKRKEKKGKKKNEGKWKERKEKKEGKEKEKEKKRKTNMHTELFPLWWLLCGND